MAQRKKLAMIKGKDLQCQYFLRLFSNSLACPCRSQFSTEADAENELSEQG